MKPPRLRLLLQLGLAALLGGCTLMSQNPAGSQSAAVADAPLWGDWVHRDDDGETIFLHVMPQANSTGKLLEVVYSSSNDGRGTWFAFEGHVNALAGERRIVSLRLVAAARASMSEIDESYPDRADYPYAFMPYKLPDHDHLLLAGPPTALLRDAVEKGRLAGTVVKDGPLGLIKLTAGPAEITALLAAQDDARLFEDATLFDRARPPAATGD
jgi:hypothetical protein